MRNVFEVSIGSKTYAFKMVRLQGLVSRIYHQRDDIVTVRIL